METNSQRRLAYIIDDEQEVRVALSVELRSMEIESRPFASAADFLDELPHLVPGCLLLDIRMPGKNGIELLAELAHLDIRWPAIMMTGHGEVITAVQAMKLGAIEFLEKPFSDDALFAALARGFATIEASIGSSLTRRQAQQRYNSLTPREQQVLAGVVAGQSNKAIAARLALSHRTVEMHRANLMRKLDASNVVDILAVVADAGVRPGG